jgi:hypothetical protein
MKSNETFKNNIYRDEGDARDKIKNRSTVLMLLGFYPLYPLYPLHPGKKKDFMFPIMFRH